MTEINFDMKRTNLAAIYHHQPTYINRTIQQQTYTSSSSSFGDIIYIGEMLEAGTNIRSIKTLLEDLGKMRK